ncbi:hypothetical protein FRC11_002718, partial [Ceratobasidium sp. 423]
MLWDELYILGCLPLLEGLTAYFEFYRGKAKYDSEIRQFPPSMFASLRKLHLRGVPSIALTRWLWNLEPLVSGLSSAGIRVNDHGFDREKFVTQIVQSMYRNSPCLESVSVQVNCPGRLGVLEAACELLSVMPLQALTLELYTGYLEDYPMAYSECTFARLRCLDLSGPLELDYWTVLPKIAKAFPNLEYLYICPLCYSGIRKPFDINGIDHKAFQSIKIQ